MSANVDLNNRPDYDRVLQDIADYVLTYTITSPEALNTARNCLMDTLGCGLLALRFPECTKHLGGQGRVGHRLHRALAGLQRHLAGGGVGASFG